MEEDDFGSSFLKTDVSEIDIVRDESMSGWSWRLLAIQRMPSMKASLFERFLGPHKR